MPVMKCLKECVCVCVCVCVCLSVCARARAFAWPLHGSASGEYIDAFELQTL